MPDSTLSGLRQLVAALERGDKRQVDDNRPCFPSLPTGHPGMDHALRGGLACGALHELFAATANDAGPLRGMATSIAAIASRGGRPVLWISQAMVAREAGVPYAPGFALMGLDPGRLILVAAPDVPALLSAAGDALASGAVAAVVAEAWGNQPALDITATRRLTLAARGSGTLVVLARLGARPAPSAAETRWHVAAAPSGALAARTPGLPVFDLTLLRHRRGISGATWRVAWMCHERQFQPASDPAAGSLTATVFANSTAGTPLSGGLAAASPDGPAAERAGGRVLRLAG